MQHVTRSMLAFTLVLAACADGGSITDVAWRTAMESARHSHEFAVLANAAVTCTNGTISGDVGTFQATPTGSFTQTICPVEGSINIGGAAAQAAYEGFLATYADLAPVPGDSCTILTGTLADVSLVPGTYCFGAAAALTGTLTLDGSSSDSWLFMIGTSGAGALIGTNFNVVLANGALACNVTWWVSQAATLTTSNFQGNILAGAGITLTGGTANGNLWSMADVTITGAELVGCATFAGNGPGGTDREKCNQGVGNGLEACDPGNSNHRRTSNDENRGVPGTPGRTGSR
jgi:hypothetical protein